jgi:chromosome segregation ATPase
MNLGFSATSTLLKEISSLRVRLRDLEDDTKSSISVAEDSPLVGMLKTDLARVEQEKANDEREFMNQLSSLSAENQAKLDALQEKLDKAGEPGKEEIEELQGKLNKAEEANTELNGKLIEAQQLQGKLNKAEEANTELNGKLIEAQQNDEYMTLLEEEREMHSKETDRMKLNLANTDLEIAESRREMDHLQEQLFESQVYKETLEEENEKLRIDCTDEIHKSESLESQLKESMTEAEVAENEVKAKDSIIEKKQEDIGEMNDALIVLEEHKQLLVSEVTDVRVQLQKVEEENSSLKEKRSAALKAAADTPSESSISSDEKRQLENAVTDLEERLQRYGEKLAEKDSKIDRLSTALTEERRTNKQVKKQIKELKGKDSSKETNNSIEQHVNSEKRVGREVQDHMSELSFLRNQNKALNDEIKSLRRRYAAPQIAPNPPLVPPGSPEPTTAKGSFKKSPARCVRPPTPLMSPPTVSRKVAVNGFRSPGGGKLSGLVASYERRIASTTGSVFDEEQELQLPYEAADLPHELEDEPAVFQQQLQSGSADLHHELEVERATVAELREKLESETNDLQLELAAEREKLAGLEAQLGHEMAQVDDLRAQLLDESSGHLSESRNDLEGRLEESQKEVERLLVRVKDLELVESTIRQSLQSEQQEANECRGRLENVDSELSEMEQKVALGEMAQSELTDNLRSAKLEVEESRAQLEKFDLERNEGEKDTERLNHEAALKIEHLQSELQQSHQMIFQEEKKEEEYEEELVQLREQVKNIQPELLNAGVEIETQQSVIVGLKQALEESRRSEKQTQALKERVTELQIEKAGIELEYSNRINDLETDLELVEVAAEEELEDKEKEIDALGTRIETLEQEIKRLEEERTHLCTSMNDVSSSRKDTIEELKDELMDVATKAKAQAREVEAMKRKLGERNSESASILKSRIKDLEEELKVVNWASRNQVHQSDIDALKKENTKFRECMCELKLDRKALQDRLDSMISSKSSSRSSQVLRDRNSALKEQVEKLTKRLRRMEDSMTRFAI